MAQKTIYLQQPYTELSINLIAASNVRRV